MRQSKTLEDALRMAPRRNDGASRPMDLLRGQTVATEAKSLFKTKPVTTTTRTTTRKQVWSQGRTPRSGLRPETKGKKRRKKKKR